MITADQITPDCPAADLAAFLKCSPSSQIQLLNIEQVELLELASDDAYADHV
jgi:hypothetical protein